MGKKRTSINIDESLLEAVAGSGVRNLSRYVESLLRADLAAVASAGEDVSRDVIVLRERLEEVRLRWRKYVKSQKSSVE